MRFGFHFLFAGAADLGLPAKVFRSCSVSFSFFSSSVIFMFVLNERSMLDKQTVTRGRHGGDELDTVTTNSLRSNRRTRREQGGANEACHDRGHRKSERR